MSESIYLFTNGTVKRKDNTIFFELEDGTKKFIPIENTRELHIFGEVTLNKDLLEYLSKKEIILHFYNYYEYYVGSFYPKEHYNSGYMTVQQAVHYIDDQKRLILARKFVQGAYLNIRKVLSYYLHRGINLDIPIQKIDQLATLLGEQTDIEKLMAIEGNIRETYYTCFDSITQNEDFTFVARTKRPPENRINTLISFGNSLLYTIVLSEIYKTHLDPRIGYLHSSNYRRFTLNLDVAEIFKPIIVDRIIFGLLNKQMIQKNDFDDHLSGLYLKDNARKLFVEKLEERLKTTIMHNKVGRETSYRRLIRMELYKIEKHLLEEEEYVPFVSEW
jgi:CRISPR-associated protein Cas1